MRQERRVTRIGVVTRSHRGGDSFRTEARDDPGGPRAVELGHARERRVRVAAVPRVRLEVARVEEAEDLGVLRALRAIPRPFDDAEGDEILADVLGIEIVRMPQALRDLFPLPLAPEAIAEIDVPVANVTGRGL